MFNVAVINIKDIGKYALKAIVIILIIAFVANFFNDNQLKQERKINYVFLECFHLTLPTIQPMEINSQTKKSILDQLLDIELKVANNITLPDGSIVRETEVSQEDKDELVIPENVTTQVLESSVKEKYTNSYGSVQIKNETDFRLTEEMLTPNSILANTKKVLIYHTHTCESYTQSEKYSYEMTGNFRTTNLDYSVARVGTELKKYLEIKGYQVIHDVTYHDSPAYSGSYDRALITASNLLQQNADTQFVFDLHRDAVRRQLLCTNCKNW